MITTLAVSGYRSLRDVVLQLEPLTLITGGNGTGKSSLYRSLRLLADVAQGRLAATVASEGGLQSVVWAGPEKISRDMRDGIHPIQGTVRSKPVSVRLGFASDDFGFAVQLGYPSDDGPFAFDPEIKLEAMWAGQALNRNNHFADRRGPHVKLRTAAAGEWRQVHASLAGHDSMMTHCADTSDGVELLALRDRMRNWRFYDSLRTDGAAPARQPQVLTYTPVLASDGADLVSALATIAHIGDRAGLAEAIDDAFPGSTVYPAGDNSAVIHMRQQGLLRPLTSRELSDGTLRYLLLVAALMTPRSPEIMVLNEPEASLHPSLLEPLARLLVMASHRHQIVVVSHSDGLIDALRGAGRVHEIALRKELGETVVPQHEAPDWTWPKL